MRNPLQPSSIDLANRAAWNLLPIQIDFKTWVPQRDWGTGFLIVGAASIVLVVIIDATGVERSLYWG